MKRMSPARAIAYGLPGLATLFTFTMFTTYGLYFFTNIVGLSGKFAGLIMTIGTLWDAVTDPLVGIISDNRDPRKGRRRPFLLVCAIPFGIVTWLLFTAWDFVEIQQKIYFIIVALLFYTFQTLIDVPYTSLSGEVTDNYDLRSKLATIRTFWAIIGVAIGGGIMAYTDFLEPVVGGSRQAWSVCFAILAQAIFLGVLVYYLRYTLDLNDTQVSLVNIIMWIVALFWVFPINRWSTKYFKVVSWTISMGIWLLCMIVFPLFFLKPGSTAAPIIMTSILVVGLNALYQVIYAMISDCVEVDELMSGERREGLFYSMATVSQKLAAASGVSVLGMIIDYVGYNPAVSVQSMQTVQGFHNIFVIGTSVCLLLSIVTMATNPLTKKRYSEVLEVVRLKRAGKEIALDEFKDLLFIKKNRK